MDKYMTKENIEYLDRHVNKVKETMRKAATPYSRNGFISLNDVTFVICDEVMGHFKILKDLKYEIGINKIFFENKFKRKYDKRLLSVIAHEFLHLYIEEMYPRNIEYMELNYSSDSSPIFLAYVNWFNYHTDIYIGINNYLDGAYDNQDCFEIDETKSFYYFEIKVFHLVKKIKEWVMKLQKEYDNRLKIYFNHNNEWGSKVTKRDDKTIIELGMLDIFDDKVSFENLSN